VGLEEVAQETRAAEAVLLESRAAVKMEMGRGKSLGIGSLGITLVVYLPLGSAVKKGNFSSYYSIDKKEGGKRYDDRPRPMVSLKLGATSRR